MLMLAIGVIKRPSFALRAAMAIMPTLAQRSIFYGVRTCALKPVEGHRASGPLKQEPSEAQLEAVLRNLRPSGRRGCQRVYPCGASARIVLPDTTSPPCAPPRYFCGGAHGSLCSSYNCTNLIRQQRKRPHRSARHHVLQLILRNVPIEATNAREHRDVLLAVVRIGDRHSVDTGTRL